MHSNDALVSLIGLLPHGISDRVREPASQILPNRQVAGIEDEAAFPVREGLRELPCYLFPCLAVEGPALAALRGVHNILSAPSATLAAADASFTISALAHA